MDPGEAAHIDPKTNAVEDEAVETGLSEHISEDKAKIIDLKSKQKEKAEVLQSAVWNFEKKVDDKPLSIEEDKDRIPADQWKVS
jgi:hypothetical protein